MTRSASFSAMNALFTPGSLRQTSASTTSSASPLSTARHGTERRASLAIHARATSRSLGGKNGRNRALNRLGRGARIDRLPDRPPDHDVVSAVGERLRNVDRALLIVRWLVLHRPDARGDHQQPFLELRFDTRRL